MSEFCFRAVGQGLFYTGSLYNGAFNFVYDCGSESGERYLNNAIDEYLSELKERHGKAEIDFVMISHLHWDHFSGIHKLAREARIKKIYLPYIADNPDIIKFILFHEIFIRDGVTPKNIEWAQEVYDFMFNLYVRNNGENEFRPEKVLQTDNLYGTPEVVLTKQHIRFSVGGFAKNDWNGVGGWVFEVFYETAKKADIKRLNEECGALLSTHGAENIEELVCKSGVTGLKKLSDMYKKIFKGGNRLNETSLVLLHYPNETGSALYQNSRANRKTLLTGDALIKRDLSEKLRYLEVSVLQVPHHGSLRNWQSTSRSNISAQTYVLNFGLGNKYKHPSYTTVEGIIEKGGKIYCVTQVQKYIYKIKDGSYFGRKKIALTEQRNWRGTSHKSNILTIADVM